jgi:hypothetical protein
LMSATVAAMELPRPADAKRPLVFISHATPQDNEFVLWLGTRLTPLGFEVWADILKLRGGQDWTELLEAALNERAAKVLLVATPEHPSISARFIACRLVAVAIGQQTNCGYYHLAGGPRRGAACVPLGSIHSSSASASANEGSASAARAASTNRIGSSFGGRVPGAARDGRMGCKGAVSRYNSGGYSKRRVVVETGEAAIIGRYLWVMAVGTLVGAACIALAVDVIDPFGISPISLSIPGLNTAKVARIDNDRFIKPYDAVRVRPKTIFLGTSRVKQGFDPEKVSGVPTPIYNAGIDAMQMSEARQLLEFYFRKRLPIERVWMEPFLYQFGFYHWAEGAAVSGKNWASDLLAATFSLSAVRASAETIAASYAGIGHATRSNGYRPFSGPHPGPGFISPQWWTTVKGFNHIPLREEAFAELDKIIALCAAHKVELLLFLGPMHPAMAQIFWSTERDMMIEWLTRLSDKPNVISFLTTQEFVDGKLDSPKRYHADTSHPSMHAGQLMMEDLASYPRLRHSRILDRASLADLISEWQEQIGAWEALNPEYIASVRAANPRAVGRPAKASALHTQ